MLLFLKYTFPIGITELNRTLLWLDKEKNIYFSCEKHPVFISLSTP